jgi:hypothetical protein
MINEDDEDIYDIPLEEIENLNENDYELKFFVWSRKIEEGVYYLEEQGRPIEAIVNYLETCAYLREKFLDPRDLTETEEYYMEKIQEIWTEYGVVDPIF